MRPFRGLSISQPSRAGASADPGRPSQGFPASRSSTELPSGISVLPRDLRVVSTTSRYSAVRPARTRRSGTTPTGLGALSGCLPRGPPRPEGLGIPSWGSAPLQRRNRQGPLHPGLPHPARSAHGVLHPLDGLLPCQPVVPKDHCRSWGSHLALLRRPGVSPRLAPWRFRRATRPRALRNTRSAARGIRGADRVGLPDRSPWGARARTGERGSLRCPAVPPGRRGGRSHRTCPVADGSSPLASQLAAPGFPGSRPGFVGSPRSPAPFRRVPHR